VKEGSELRDPLEVYYNFGYEGPFFSHDFFNQFKGAINDKFNPMKGLLYREKIIALGLEGKT
jgi:hypothetical protein